MFCLCLLAAIGLLFDANAMHAGHHDVSAAVVHVDTEANPAMILGQRPTLHARSGTGLRW